MFTTSEIEVELTDLGDKGSSQGDLRAFSQELFEEGAMEPAGRLDGSVAITDIDESTGTPVEYRIVALGNYRRGRGRLPLRARLRDRGRQLSRMRCGRVQSRSQT